jgi:hypothetical protein
MLADSGETTSQSPETQSVSGDGLYTLRGGGLCNQSFLHYMGQLHEHKLIIKFAPHPPIECGCSYRKLQG